MFFRATLARPPPRLLARSASPAAAMRGRLRVSRAAAMRGRLRVSRAAAMSTAAAATAATTTTTPALPRRPGPAHGTPATCAHPYYEGTVRVDVRKSPQLVGQTSSRGTRAYNQDRAEFTPLRVPGMVADRRDRTSAQLMYLGVYDGYIETVSVDSLQVVVEGMRSYGKDWAGYTPGALRGLEAAVLRHEPPSFLTIEERLTLAFLMADDAIKNMRWSDGQGSTACTALVWDAEGLPFWSHDSHLDMVVASAGDSKAILCRTQEGGRATALNTLHHPDVRGERERLQRHGAFFSRDSFGEERAMARVANTRAFGDWQVKRFGVVAEPEIRRYELQGDEAAFLVIVSDGVTSVLTDQEIVDVAKGCADPAKAARRVVDVAERLGSDDNMTAQVLRLPGWDCELEDLTADHRKHRLDSVDRVMRLRGSMLSGPHGGGIPTQDASGCAAAVRLTTPERLLRRIFTTHQRPQRGNGSSSQAQGPRLTVAQIQQRVRASGLRLTLVAEPEDLELDTDEDSGSVIAVPEVMRMTLSVLGLAGASLAQPARDCALTPEQEAFSLSLQQTDRAWRLIGLHVIEA
ncbi:Protein phosphatase 2C 6 [Coemansia sp. RSA 552]|nr:Protein phosphatase 2C 6 [Coemansia sp. RSA 552]